MKEKLFLLSMALLTCSHSSAQTVISDSAGFASISLPPGGSIVVPTLVNVATYLGNATIAANTITPATSPNWTPGALAETNLARPAPNYPTYYVEIVAGAYQGYSFDIVTNDAASVTLSAGEIPAALIGQTLRVAVRKHVTLDAIAAGQTGLNAYVDAVNIINSDGSTSTRYFTGTSWVAEDYATPAGQTIIYPGNGFAISTSGAVQLPLAGSVKATSTAIPIYKGYSNIVGPLNPVASTALVSLNLAPALTPYVDTFNLYSTNGKATLLGTYYSDGTNILNSSYVALGTNATDAIPANSGIFLSASKDGYWILPPPVFP